MTLRNLSLFNIVIRNTKKTVFPALLLVSYLILTGCNTDKEEKYEEKPVLEIFKKANKSLEEGSFKKAAKEYEEVIRQHPYSSYATRAQYMAAYAHYRAKAYEDAIVSVDAFIQLHPGHKMVPYCYYLKGLCYYTQIESVERDQKMTERATTVFTELIKRFPNNKHAKDAKIKIDTTHNFMAGNNMEIGRFYESQHLLLSALDRFKFVITNYATTTHSAEALYRLVEVNLQLGIVKEAQAAAMFLSHNFPGSLWYKQAYDLLNTHNLLVNDQKNWNLTKTWEKSTLAAQSNNS